MFRFEYHIIQSDMSNEYFIEHCPLLIQHPRFRKPFVVSVLKYPLVTFQLVYAHPNIIRCLRTHSEIKNIWNFHKFFKKAQFFVDFDPKIILAPANWGVLFVTNLPPTYLQKCSKTLPNLQFWRFQKWKQRLQVSDFSPKTAKIKIQRLGLRGGTFVPHETLFSTEEIVSMPAPPAACGYARLKPCVYAGRKRPALPE